MASKGVPFSLKVSIILYVLLFGFRPVEPPGFERLTFSDDFLLVILARRYAPGYSYSTLSASGKFWNFDIAAQLTRHKLGIFLHILKG
ncbi:hypothetical protein [uncultured Draconibacterium sp.]|uniref:hypothetical protein n=1 Tax=uncultured Draconibacterium sp. TaxID=1573823 RepID=UPI0029C6343F|nr:hypothetical protein [uncultured Draconibacterium sp.]